VIDFAKAFDVVDHAILLGKHQTLGIDQFALDWIVSFLSNRHQVCKTDGPLPINQGIVQGSGLGPFLYLVMENDVNALSVFNLIFKSADDTNLLVPENTNVSLSVEYDRCKQWAELNHLVIDHNKTPEIVFHLPRVSSLHLPPKDDSI